ncbi:MAG: M15 family metallopeptidase [Fusobacterium gastrosuis]|uniref:M15 family metallopeptidase n=1 Tax=Fusobacterium gastrosuis TaxID=1755100 RepID=UPI002A883847|nr:M15 family metallopeptidase [Fusobacterium gastrosuis]
MPKFSKRSLEILKTCHPDLQKIALRAIKRIDFKIIEGHRTTEQQKQKIKQGFSKTMKSKHCFYPSLAFDFVPYPFKQEDWEDYERFNKVGEILLECANELRIKARRGADWNMNGSTKDEVIRGTYDGPHFELM